MITYQTLCGLWRLTLSLTLRRLLTATVGLFCVCFYNNYYKTGRLTLVQVCLFDEIDTAGCRYPRAAYDYLSYEPGYLVVHDFPGAWLVMHSEVSWLRESKCLTVEFINM